MKGDAAELCGYMRMDKLKRLIYKHSDKGIKNLMLYIIIGNIIIYVMAMTDRGALIVNNLVFYPSLIRQGEIWRILTFIFVPESFGNILFFILSLYFYYMISQNLEREWGTLKFNIFYFTGVILTIIYSLLSGAGATVWYINMSLFLAFATLYPDMQLMLFFVLPVKVKYLAYIDAVILLIPVLTNPFPYNLLPLVAIGNYLLFFGGEFYRMFKNRSRYNKRTIEFKNKVKDIKKERGYLHKCVICGKTDVSHPNAEFRYCSLCKEYACYCEEHIMEHEHI